MQKKKWVSWAVMVLAVFVLLAGGCGSDSDDDTKTVADTIYYNGNVYTVDEARGPITQAVDAFAVKGDKLLYVGDRETASTDHAGDDTKFVDLGGKTVIPGIIENHLHFDDTGIMKITPDTNWQPKDWILTLIGMTAAELAPGEWIYSFGWTEGSPWWNWEFNGETFAASPDRVMSPPTKWDLDAVAPDNPVFLIRTDGHSAWLNSAALTACGITEETPDTSEDPENAPDYEKNEDGELTGIIREKGMYAAYYIAQSHIPMFSDPVEKLAMYKAAEDTFLSYGITTFADAGITAAEVNFLGEKYKEGSLKARAYEMLAAGEEEKFGKPVLGEHNGKFSVNAVKVYADGSFGSRSAWLSEPFADDPSTDTNYGAPVYSSDGLKEVIKRASDLGFQVGTHAIGDRGVTETIDAYIAAAGSSLPDRRFKIEHYSMTMPDDLKRVVDNGIVASIQGSFVPSDHSGSMVDNRVGPDRLKYVYTWRTMIDAGLEIVGGSDSPVEDVNPFRNMHAAVTRQFIDANVPEGDPNLPWQPQEKITREEALKSYTIWGAYAVFGEKDRGSLTAGKYADFVVIDRDYFGDFPDADLQRITVLETYVGGEKVYDAAENSAEAVSVRRMRSAFNLTHAQIRAAGGECPQCSQALASTRIRQKMKK